MSPETPAAEPRYTNPLDFLKTIPGAPGPDQLAAWKQQVPGGRIQLFTPDGRRVFIVRGLSGLELAEIQAEIPANAKDPESEARLKIAARCTLWTNTSSNNQLAELQLRTGPAGLPESIHQIVSHLSDFFDPVQLASFSAEL